MIGLLATPAGRMALFYGGVILLLAGSHTWVYFEGRTARDNEVKVENAELAKQVAEAYQIQVNYGNLKAAEVEAQREQSAAKLSEVLSNVHKVTTNRPCLSSNAVRLLNKPGTGIGLPTSPSSATTESSGRVASDTDLAQWGIKVKDQYERCSSRLNGIIDILQLEGRQ